MLQKINIAFLLLILGSLVFPKSMLCQTMHKVQLAAFDRAVPVNYFSGVWNVRHAVDKNGFHKYYLEGFENREAAVAKQKEMRQMGYHAVVIDQSLDSYLCRNSCASPARIDEIKPLFFDFDQSSLRTTSVRELEKLYQVLVQQPTVSVTFRAHTDAKGTSVYNQRLAERRALAARKYLLNKGIASYRLLTSIHGEAAPVAINTNNAGKDSPNGRQLNRRVEIEIYDEAGKPLNVKVAPIRVPSALSLNNTKNNNQG